MTWNTLTPRQRDILRFVADSRSAQGAAPMLREIGAAFGVSVACSRQHLRALARKGYVSMARYAHRGVRLERNRREWRLGRVWQGEFDRRFGAWIAGETDLRKICDRIRGDLRAWLDVGRADLLLYDPRQHRLRPASSFGASPAGNATGQEPPAVDALADRALKRRRPVVEPNVERAVVPVLGRDRVLGVLRLDAHPRGGIDEAVISRAVLAAAALTPALERATLGAELRHQTRLQAALTRLIQVVNSARDLRRILRDVEGIVRGMVEAPVFLFVVRDDEGRWWTLLETDEIGGERVERIGPNLSLITDANEAVRAIQTAPHWIRHRTPEEVRALESTGPVATGNGLVGFGHVTKRSASILYVPLRTGGRLIGSLSVQSYRHDAYTLRDAEDLTLVGEYLGLVAQASLREEFGRERQASERERQERCDRLPEELTALATVPAAEVRRRLRALAGELAGPGGGPDPAA